jgi:subtilisin family serine protease
MDPLDLVKLSELMARTSGSPGVTIGLIDGPVAMQHPDLAGNVLRDIAADQGSTCTEANDAACVHGTFVAGILAAKRDSSAPAICPGCTVLVRPLFAEGTVGRDQMPTATPNELAAAIVDCIDAGARIINLSLALARPSTAEEPCLEEALNLAVKRGVIVAAAAGNQGTIGGSAITRHPWVIPVAACDLRGRPMNQSNLGGSIGRRGLSAPGDGVRSLGADGLARAIGGTSVAVPFVTGAAALLWSEFPSATAARIKLALAAASAHRRPSVVPPLLDVALAYRTLLSANPRR